MKFPSIPEEDRDLILEVETLASALSNEVAAHIRAQPSLQLAYDKYETPADRFLIDKIASLRGSLPNPCDNDLSAKDRHQIEMQYSILNSHISDLYIGIAARFLRAETLSALVHKSAMEHPVVFLKVMAKYNMRNCANALSHRLGWELHLREDGPEGQAASAPAAPSP